MLPKSGLDEFLFAFKKHDPWLLLGWHDIRQRYKRSLLGPIWLTLSTAILVTTLGLLWSTLFKLNLSEYMPFFAIGHVIWGFIVMQVNDSCTGFTQFEHIIKQTRLPMATYALRLLTRNAVILAHNALIIIFVISFIGDGWSWRSLYAIPSFMILSVTMLSFSIAISIACTKYRDIQQIVQNLTTIAFFVTPIMWKPELLGESRRWVSDFNPLAHLLHIIREPLLGNPVSPNSWIVSSGLMLASAVLAWFLMDKYRNRIAYWL